MRRGQSWLRMLEHWSPGKLEKYTELTFVLSFRAMCQGLLVISSPEVLPIYKFLFALLLEINDAC